MTKKKKQKFVKCPDCGGLGGLPCDCCNDDHGLHDCGERCGECNDVGLMDCWLCDSTGKCTAKQIKLGSKYPRQKPKEVSL